MVKLTIYSKGVGTLQLLGKPLVNIRTKGAEYKGIIIVADKLIELLRPARAAYTCVYTFRFY